MASNPVLSVTPSTVPYGSTAAVSISFTLAPGGAPTVLNAVLTDSTGAKVGSAQVTLNGAPGESFPTILLSGTPTAGQYLLALDAVVPGVSLVAGATPGSFVLHNNG